MRDFIRATIWPILTLAVLGSLAATQGPAMAEFGVALIGGHGAHLPTVVEIGAWIAGGMAAGRSINHIIWDFAVEKATGTPAPRLVKQLTSLLVAILTLTGIIGFVFGHSVTGILTTSGAVGLLLGFAVRNLILDLFSGLSINLERPFQAGEYIQIHIRGVSNVFGRVEETNWRTTRLATPEGSIQIIPNSTLGASVITNYSRPSPLSEFELILTLDPAVEPERARRVLMAGLMQAVADGGPLASPEPKVRVTGVDDTGIRYKLKYFLDPRKGGPGKVRHVVLDAVLGHLRRAGMRQAFPKSELLHTPMGEGLVGGLMDRDAAVSAVQEFEALAPSERQNLVRAARQRDLAPGDVLVRAGADMDTIFVVAEGWLDARQSAEGAPSGVAVGHFGPGTCFGMPPTDGKPVQPATVVAAAPTVIFEISAEDAAQALAAHPDVTRRLADAEAGRHAAYGEELSAQVDALRAEAQQSQKRLIGNLVGQVRSLFANGAGPLSKAWQGLMGANGSGAFADALMAACALVATADGSVDESERRHVRKVFDDIGLLQHLDGEQGMSRFEANAVRLVDDESAAVVDFLETVGRLAPERDKARIILSVCRALSAADGFADAEEEARIGMIAEALDMAEAHTGHFDERMFD